MSRVYKARALIVLICTAAYLGFLNREVANFISQTDPFLSYGSTQEQILELTAARNFVQYGFLTNFFLADYSSSPRATDHPYLYTHQPSFPAVALGVLLKAGLSVKQSRFFFCVLSNLGYILLFLLIWQILKVPELALLGLIVFGTTYDATLQWVDHFVHSFGGLTFFGTLFFYFRYLEKRSRLSWAGFVVCLTLGFATNYITSIPCFVTILVLHFFFHRQSLESRRLVLSTWACMLTAAAALFGRNVLVLGPIPAIKDFLFTISNRVTGWPDKEAMASFFESNRIVLWGVWKVSSGSLADWFWTAFWGPIKNLNVLPFVALAVFLGYANRHDRFVTLKRCALLLVCFIGAYAWHIIFFAQGAIYPFPNIHRMFGLAYIVIAGFLLIKAWSLLSIKSNYDKAVTAVVTLATIGFVDRIKSDLRTEWRVFNRIKQAEFAMPPLRTFQRLGQFNQNTVASNMDSNILAFFTSSLVFGGCHKQSLADGTSKGCFSAFVDNKTREVAKPDIIVVSNLFVPGYVDCQEKCIEGQIQDLKKDHVLLLEEPGIWAVFEAKPTVKGQIATQ